MAYDITPFASEGPEFAKLRPDVREMARTSEVEFRKAMEEALDVMPAYLAGAFYRMAVAIPARFISGLFPVFQQQSELMDFAEIINRHLGKQFGGGERRIRLRVAPSFEAITVEPFEKANTWFEAGGSFRMSLRRASKKWRGFLYSIVFFQPGRARLMVGHCSASAIA